MRRTTKALTAICVVLMAIVAGIPVGAECPKDGIEGCLTDVTDAVEDGGGAAVSNAESLATAALETAEGTIGQVTGPAEPACYPAVAGKDVVQRTGVGVGEIFGRDQATASGLCSTLASVSYTSRIEVEIQAFNMPTAPNIWSNVCGFNSAFGVPGGQATQVFPPVTISCSYPSGSPFLGKYHRGRAVIYPSVGPPHAMVTLNIWYMAP